MHVDLLAIPVALVLSEVQSRDSFASIPLFLLELQRVLKACHLLPVWQYKILLTSVRCFLLY